MRHFEQTNVLGLVFVFKSFKVFLAIFKFTYFQICEKLYGGELRKQPPLLFSMVILFFSYLLEGKSVTRGVTVLPNG